MNLDYTFKPDSNPEEAGDYTLIISDANNPEFSDIIWFNIYREIGIPQIHEWGSMESSAQDEYREEFNKSIKPESELKFMIESFSDEMRSKNKNIFVMTEFFKNDGHELTTIINAKSLLSAKRQATAKQLDPDSSINIYRAVQDAENSINRLAHKDCGKWEF